MVWFQVSFYMVISDWSVTYSPKIWCYCFDNEKNATCSNSYLAITILKKSCSCGRASISHWNLGWPFSQVKSLNIKWPCGCRNLTKSRTSPKTEKIRTFFCLRRAQRWLRQTSRQMMSLTDTNTYVYQSSKPILQINTK